MKGTLFFSGIKLKLIIATTGQTDAPTCNYLCKVSCKNQLEQFYLKVNNSFAYNLNSSLLSRDQHLSNYNELQ